MTKAFKGMAGRVRKLKGVEVELEAAEQGGTPRFVEIPGTEFEIKADLVLLAMGFVHPVHKGVLDDLSVALDPRGNVIVDENYMTNIAGVFSAGDMTLGASLVVRAISQGRETARAIDMFLMGETSLT